jgi:hypothetical protein
MKELLKALADSDRELEAPVAVEMRLRSAFRKQHARPKWPYFALAASAAMTLLVLRTKPAVNPQVVQARLVTPAKVEPPAPPVPRKTVHRKPPPKEVVTVFFPLMEDPPPFERGELLRVQVPASAMRSVGLPVSEDHLDDPVQADVLIGQEGLARAIRFVNTRSLK